MLTLGARLLLLALLFGLIPPVVAAEPRNILNMSQGTVVLSYTSEYDDTKWSALNVFDGYSDTTWSSKSTKPQTFLVELPQKFELQTVVADTRDAQDRKYPGISAKEIEIWGSTTSANAGFTKRATLVAPPTDRASYKVEGKPVVQWLKFVVTENWGNGQYVELSELEAYGNPVGPATNPSFNGVFTSNWGPMKLQQKGKSVSGCYPRQAGSIRGGVEGHVMKFDWNQKGTGTFGTALMVVNSAGTVLNGVWYMDGQMRGEWLGKRADGEVCNCQPEASSIANRLRDTKRAIIYGIYFDPGSAIIKPESESALLDILQAVTANPKMKMQVEGHTDSTNTDQYNQALSQKRAQSVLAWLKGRGVPNGRVTAKGFGESNPVADNATPQGRALNRRVEVASLN